MVAGFPLAILAQAVGGDAALVAFGLIVLVVLGDVLIRLVGRPLDAGLVVLPIAHDPQVPLGLLGVRLATELGDVVVGGRRGEPFGVGEVGLQVGTLDRPIAVALG